MEFFSLAALTNSLISFIGLGVANAVLSPNKAAISSFAEEVVPRKSITVSSGFSSSTTLPFCSVGCIIGFNTVSFRFLPHRKTNSCVRRIPFSSGFSVRFLSKYSLVFFHIKILMFSQPKISKQIWYKSTHSFSSIWINITPRLLKSLYATSSRSRINTFQRLSKSLYPT